MEDQLPAELERFLSMTQTYASAAVETISDVHHGMYLQNQSLQRSSGFYYGVVKHYTPYLGTYRVSVAGMNGEIICKRMMTDSTTDALGVTDGLAVATPCSSTTSRTTCTA